MDPGTVGDLVSTSVIEASLDAIICIDEQSRIILWNPAAEAMFGHARQEAIGQPLSMLMREQDRSAHLAGLEHFLSTEEPRLIGKVVEIFGLKKDGSTFNAEMSLSAKKIEGSWVFTAILRDLVERSKIEESMQQRLKEGEQSRKAMLYMLEDLNESAAAVEQIKNEWVQTFDAVSDPIFSHDADFHIVRANRAYAECAGVDVEDVIGKPYWEVFPKRDGPLPGCLKSIQNAAADEEDEEEIRLENGRVFLNHSYAMREEGKYISSIHLMEDITERIQAEDALLASHQKLKKALEGSIAAIASAVEARDPYTAGHQRRVASLAVAMARQMDLEPDRIEGIRMGGIIHDIGKIHLPAEILSKPARLTDIEYSLIKAHPQVGYDILKDVDFPWPVACIAHQHHERLDGSGYPQGLQGDAICLEARIVAVADIVEAMSSHRPYRPGLGIEVALNEVESQAGKTLDAAAVNACLKLFREEKFSFEE